MSTELSLLFVNYEYPPIGGGGGATTKFLAEALARRGHKVHVLTGALRGKAAMEYPHRLLSIERLDHGRRNPDACSIPEMGRFVLAAAHRLRFLRKSNAFDLVHCFFSMPTGATLLLSNARRLPYCISLLGGDVPGFLPEETNLMHRLLLPATRSLWRKAQAVMPNSEGLAALARNTLDRKFDVISNGVDTEEFHARGACDDSLPRRILFVGRLVPQKGLDLLLQSLSLLVERMDFRLTVVGDGPSRTALMEHARALGLSDRIDWNGWVGLEELPAIYRSHQILALPSRFEGMASVMLQAMACGCAVVSSDVFGARDVIGVGIGGEITPIGDVGAFADALGRLANLERLSIKRAAAVDRVQDFSWLSLADRLEMIYTAGLERML